MIVVICIRRSAGTHRSCGSSEFVIHQPLQRKKNISSSWIRGSFFESFSRLGSQWIMIRAKIYEQKYKAGGLDLSRHVFDAPIVESSTNGIIIIFESSCQNQSRQETGNVHQKKISIGGKFIADNDSITNRVWVSVHYHVIAASLSHYYYGWFIRFLVHHLLITPDFRRG